MFEREMKCQMCGTPFIAHCPTAKFCKPCGEIAAKEVIRRKHERYRQRKAERQTEPKPKPPTLDERLIALKREGISYAEAQKRETIERYARVHV